MRCAKKVKGERGDDTTRLGNSNPEGSGHGPDDADLARTLPGRTMSGAQQGRSGLRTIGRNRPGPDGQGRVARRSDSDASGLVPDR